jgi:MurNAc alpha-1-phosphate uridylyltransferase
MTKITQAFIFAAGRGERMRPLTNSIPKPLVKIKNKSIIDYTIEKLDQISAIKKIIINGFYLAEQLEAHIKRLNNPKIIFSHEVEKVETGGGLVFAKNKFDPAEPLLTINGDVLWQDVGAISDIENLCEAWDASACDILLGLKKTDDYFGYEGNIHGGGDFDLRGDRLFRFPDCAMSHVFVGLQIINPKILERAPRGIDGKCFSMSHFYKSAVGEGGLVHRIKGVELAGKYFHIGTVDAVREVGGRL